MKILIASDSYKYQTSGVANVVIAHVNELRRRGYSVKVLTLSNNGESYRDGDDYYIGSLPFLVYPDLRISFVRKDPLFEELKEWKPDIIHMHTEGSVARMARAIAEENDTPYVMTSHTDYAQYVFGRFCSTVPVRIFASKCGSVGFRGAKVITAPSEKALTFPQLSTVIKHTVVIPNGIKLEQYQKKFSAEEKANLFQKYGLTDNGKTIVIVSRVSKEKNIKEVLTYLPSLIEKMPDVQLIIVGDGPDRKRLETYTQKQELSGHVTFTGRISPEEVYRYYDMGNLFVSASTFEVHSLTYLEAMACGLPLVCRDDLCLKGVLENGVNGFTYQTEEEFVESVTKILTDDELRGQMHENALKTAADFSDKRFVDRMLELYEKVINSEGEDFTFDPEE